MDATTYYASIADNWKLVLLAIIGVLLIFYCTKIALLFLRRILLMRRDMTWLEITPPATINRTPEATEQLFSVLHGMHTTRTVLHRLLGLAPVMSFEIVSTKTDGIRYLVQVEQTKAKGLQKLITSYVPDIKVALVDRDIMSSDEVLEFHESNHYILPITITDTMSRHDPLTYLTGSMTQLVDNEEMTFQLIVTPVKLREARMLAHRILGNEDILQQVKSGSFKPLSTFSKVASKITSGATSLTSEVYMGTTYGYKNFYSSRQPTPEQRPIRNPDKPARTLSTFELELMEGMHKKVTQPLFRVDIRLLVKSSRSKELGESIRQALDGFSVAPYQELKVKWQLPPLQAMRESNGTKRIPSVLKRSSQILASSELAALYHFSSNENGRTDNLITSLSRTLPAPVSMKKNDKKAIYIGENLHHGLSTPIGLSESERERHVYIIGGTGNGKTTMLFYSILQDIQNGAGAAVIDPHGDLAERLLRYIPEDRIKDVIYMNPDDLTYPIGVNLLELDPKLTGDDLLREKDLITEATISVLRKIFSEDDSGGHRIEYVLRNAIQTALTLESPTLFTIFELLNDAKFRRSVVKTLQDKNLKNFWENELGKAGEFQRVKMAAGITAKIGRFLFSASARRVLEQPRSTINFEEILAGNKILICNFSKGMLGEDTSSLFGTTMLAKLQTAALRRARIEQSHRRPYYLYVDEFQNFATTSFVQMLSEARKYKLFLTMAEQSTSQQDQQRLVDIILANVGTVICFRSGSPSDERMVLPLFSPYINQGEIANLPAYSFYARVAAIHAQEPMSGMTVVVDELGSTEVANRVKESSRALYARKVEPVPTTEHKPISAESRSTPKRKNQPKERASIKPIS